MIDEIKQIFSCIVFNGPYIIYVFLLCVYAPASVRLRHADRQHGGIRPAEGGSARQGAGSHAEETPPPEREKAQQSHSFGALHC